MPYKNKEKMKAYQKAYYEANKAYQKAYYEANKEKIAEKKKAYREANKEKIAEQRKAYYEANKEKIKAYRESNKEKIKAYCKANKQKIADYQKARYEANKEKIAEQQKVYREANKQKIADYKKAYEKQRKKRDPIFRLKLNYRRSCHTAFESIGQKKNNSSLKLLGLKTWQELAEHLELRFYDHPETGEKMTFDNHGYYGWHIDHIIPLSSAKTEKEIIKLCHYTNLQPLWAEENLAKSNKILDTQ